MPCAVGATDNPRNPNGTKRIDKNVACEGVRSKVLGEHSQVPQHPYEFCLPFVQCLTLRSSSLSNPTATGGKCLVPEMSSTSRPKKHQRHAVFRVKVGKPQKRSKEARGDPQKVELVYSYGRLPKHQAKLICRSGFSMFNFDDHLSVVHLQYHLVFVGGTFCCCALQGWSTGEITRRTIEHLCGVLLYHCMNTWYMHVKQFYPKACVFPARCFGILDPSIYIDCKAVLSRYLPAGRDILGV